MRGLATSVFTPAPGGTPAAAARTVSVMAHLLEASVHRARTTVQVSTARIRTSLAANASRATRLRATSARRSPVRPTAKERVAPLTVLAHVRRASTPAGMAPCGTGRRKHSCLTAVNPVKTCPTRHQELRSGAQMAPHPSSQLALPTITRALARGPAMQTTAHAAEAHRQRSLRKSSARSTAQRHARPATTAMTSRTPNAP